MQITTQRMIVETGRPGLQAVLRAHGNYEEWPQSDPNNHPLRWAPRVMDREAHDAYLDGLREWAKAVDLDPWHGHHVVAGITADIYGPPRNCNPLIPHERFD